MVEKQVRKPVYFAETLNFMVFFVVFIKQLKNRKPAEIILLDHPKKNIWGNLLQKISKIEQITVDPRGLADFKGDDGANLGWHRDQMQLAISQYLFKSKHIDDFKSQIEKSLRGYNLYTADDVIKIFVMHSVASHSRHHLYVMMTLSSLYAEKKQDIGENSSIIVPKHFYIAQYIKKTKQINVVQYGFSFGLLTSATRLLKRLKFIIFLCVSNIFGQTEINENSTKVAMQAPWNLCKVQHVMGVDYFESGHLQQSDMLYFGEDVEKSIRRDFHPFPVVKNFYSPNIHNFGAETLALAQNLFRIWCFFLAKLFKTIDQEYEWFWNIFFDFFVDFERTASFFKAFNIKSCIHFGDTSCSYVPQYLSVETLGGVDLSVEFSATGSHLIAGCRPVFGHQYMIWGQAEWDMLQIAEKQARLKTPSAAFMTGHITHYLLDQTSVEAEQCYNALRNNCEKIIVVLDAITNKTKISSPLQAQEFNADMLDYAIKNQDIGLFYKPQEFPMLSKEGMQKYEALKQQGRIVMIQKEFISPFLVLKYADFAVGFCSYNSAMSEAAIAGVPHIYYDNASWLHHVNYQHAPSDFIAQNRLELFEKLDKGLSSKGLRPNDPEFRKYANWIDPFQDKKGHHRVSELCRMWMDEIKKRGDASQAFPFICDKYRKFYGDDKVMIRK